MNHFGLALSELVARRYNGNRSALAKEIRSSPSTIGRFCSGEVEPTLDRLEAICRQCDEAERRVLLLAAARDRIPAAYQKEIFTDGNPEAERLRAGLPEDLAAVIRYLENSALNDPGTASYLRKIGEWVGISRREARLMVAESDEPHDVPPAKFPVTYPRGRTTRRKGK